ncbi:MAG TPA: DUF429 domain-containing protein [Nitrospiria bacterium]
MPWVAGVDGCRGGWFVVLVNFNGKKVQKTHWTVCSSFQEVLQIKPSPRAIAVDIPIGLLDQPVSGGRECDRLARLFLGRPRASSIFSPPIRKILSAKKFSQVRGLGMTIQAFHIIPKVREVDQLMTPVLQEEIFEAHPEAVFKGLQGGPMKHNKKTIHGRKDRIRVLFPFFPDLERGLIATKDPNYFFDDIIDAHALAVTAFRIMEGQAKRFPQKPPNDSKGLRMEIWY